MNFCCKNFQYRIENNSVIFYNERHRYDILTYYPKTREYITEHGCDYGYQIFYCPWCGTKLPSDLSDKWDEVLKEEYGIIDPRGSEKAKVPEEFKTDEWWKKRGL